jgi:hypothetical protein
LIKIQALLVFSGQLSRLASCDWLETEIKQTIGIALILLGDRKFKSKALLSIEIYMLRIGSDEQD